MGMSERDRVMNAFRNCITEPKCKDCPWDECEALGNRKVEIPLDLVLAVMRELAAQEPRVMTLEEVQLYENSLTLEVRNAEGDEYNGLHTALHVAELDFNNPPCEVFGISGFEHTELLRDDTYGVDWRCWTARPTDEQREAEPWE